MRILNLSEAEKLIRVIIPEDESQIDTTWQNRAKLLFWIRQIYKKGFSICVGENVLWDNTPERTKDLTGGV